MNEMKANTSNLTETDRDFDKGITNNNALVDYLLQLSKQHAERA